MAKAHFGSKISPNMKRTPEDFLICYNVPIARTGVQKYLGRELGLNDRSDDIIKVYRTEDEVFNPKTIASFEGKVFVDEHPNDWVTPLNFQTYGKGVITNVRRGIGKDKDLLLADIIVYSLAQIEEIESKQKREVSCGYECEYVPYKDGYMQKNIIGNHVALVNAGRAGSRVAIKDNKLKENEGGKRKMGERSYRIPKRQKTSEFLQAVGLKHVAQDADPEDILDAMNDLIEEKKSEDEDGEKYGVEQASKLSANESTSDAENEEMKEVKEALTDVKDALYVILNSKTKDEEEVKEDPEPNNEGMESLDELEEELSEEETEDADIDEIEEVEKPAEEMNEDEACEEMGESEKMKDSAVELMRVLKPIISYIPDKKERKKVSDNLAKVLRKQVKDAKMSERKKKNTVYSDILKGRSKDSDYNSVDIGKMIAEKYNPHYMKEGK